MISLRKPQPQKIRQFIRKQQDCDFSYPAVGSTAEAPPAGYVLDHTRVCLGEGHEVFASAKRAFARWQQFELGWLTQGLPDARLEPGQHVVILGKSLGIWWLNACRIVYVIDEASPLPRFGFAYGTLPDHAGSGEERFLLEMDTNGQVWYDILAFSRPQRISAKLGYPYLRRLQKRFARDSVAKMKSCVGNVEPLTEQTR